MKKRILTVGDGVAAWCLHDELLKRENIHITNISAPEHFPPCSKHSTSINCLRGTTRGISMLGDLIVDSFSNFELFFEEEKPRGIVEGVEYQLWNNLEKWKRRYPSYFSLNKSHEKCTDFLRENTKGMEYFVANKAYFIDSCVLRDWFYERHSEVHFKNECVLNIDAHKKVLTSIGEYQFDEIYLCTNYATALLAKGLSEKFDYYLDHSKPVAGTFLEIDIKKMNLTYKDDFNLAFEKYHFIYRPSLGVIQLGSTTDNNCDIHLPNERGVKEIYNFIQNSLQVSLPEFEEFRLRTGVRHKGHERLPKWEGISPGIFTICGLYKNAYTFAFKAAKDLLK